MYVEGGEVVNKRPTWGWGALFIISEYSRNLLMFCLTIYLSFIRYKNKTTYVW